MRFFCLSSFLLAVFDTLSPLPFFPRKCFIFYFSLPVFIHCLRSQTQNLILTNNGLKRSYPSEPVGCRTPHRSDGLHFCSLLSGIQFLSLSFTVNETFEEECEEVAEHLFIKGQTRSCRRDGVRALSESFLRTFEEESSRIITTQKLLLG